jgi:hypothetical protein
MKRPLVEQVTMLFLFLFIIIIFCTRRRYLKAVPTVGATCRSVVLATCPPFLSVDSCHFLSHQDKNRQLLRL